MAAKPLADQQICGENVPKIDKVFQNEDTNGASELEKHRFFLTRTAQRAKQNGFSDA